MRKAAPGSSILDPDFDAPVDMAVLGCIVANNRRQRTVAFRRDVASVDELSAGSRESALQLRGTLSR